MDSSWQRVAEDLIGRLTGPLHLRLYLQPVMATFFGIRDGIDDAREGKPAYFWAIFTNSGQRKELLKSGQAHDYSPMEMITSRSDAEQISVDLSSRTNRDIVSAHTNERRSHADACNSDVSLAQSVLDLRFSKYSKSLWT
jgi:hypothetical protein